MPGVRRSHSKGTILNTSASLRQSKKQLYRHLFMCLERICLALPRATYYDRVNAGGCSGSSRRMFQRLSGLQDVMHYEGRCAHDSALPMAVVRSWAARQAVFAVGPHERPWATEAGYVLHDPRATKAASVLRHPETHPVLAQCQGNCGGGENKRESMNGEETQTLQ